MAEKSVIVIGSGFAGLSAASFMAKEGWKVTVLEKNTTAGGRARQLKENGFTFDMGPSFYWMPDVFERYFNQFGKKVSDYYSLHRLDPSYRIYWDDGYTDMPADFEQLKKIFESIEPGSAEKLEKYLKGAAYKYEVGVNKLVYKPSRSLTEFMDWETISGVFKLQVFSSIKSHIAKYFRHPKLRQIMEFPVLFLGALPEDTPALYSLMNYADIKGGTWYPQGGIYAVVDGMYRLAVELGVKFHFEEDVKEIAVKEGTVKTVSTDKAIYEADAVISGADYHFTETKLLSEQYRSYSAAYWDKRVMAPSCLMYYVGLNKKLKQPIHHSLFFDVPFEQHGKEIYKDPKWPAEPLFYVSVSSLTDDTVAPEGHENIVFLIPIASGLEGDTEELREKYFQLIAKRMEKQTGESILDSIVYKKTFSVSDFVHDYNSFKGNAYGLANTLRQTAIFRPSCQSKKVKNLFYTGQLTVPGPGVPPSLISGEVVAKQVIKVLG
ncbi:MAG: phytoene desaturase family protein [Chitinophagaceae bacterium]|nr:phytoene desaturase [Chitinophagaceae bacterium]MBK9465356.1 phytoene desaturase [Chitinophagaceae bacterium]MBP6416642.1 phytoene desaturase [Chitinophagaceae bacterium]